MEKTELSRVTGAVVAHLKANPNLPFSQLIDSVQHELNVDEATVKAAVLRLSSEGMIEVALNWTVRPMNDAADAA